MTHSKTNRPGPTRTTRFSSLSSDDLRRVSGGGEEDEAVAAARDAASGLPTGKRSHKPISLVMDLG